MHRISEISFISARAFQMEEEMMQHCCYFITLNEWLYIKITMQKIP